jgi:dTDP-4-amino-4,6-dideoxygalactose transaminase
MIPFNKPYLTGNEKNYIDQVLHGGGKWSGNGVFTKKCQELFAKRYGFNKCLMTTSCTDALEMAAWLIDLQPGDEVIMPSYTFPSAANAFVMCGAKIVFADSEADSPNMDVASIEALITPKTKAISPVHYAGVACDMNAIMELANKHGIYVIEDAAQAIDAKYNDRPLGGIGHLAAFSFHETKNVTCGEGGMLVINDSRFEERAEILWEKGTNRVAFARGEIEKYEWVDVGSSYLPADMVAAFLYAQLEKSDDILQKRVAIWNRYYEQLSTLKDKITLPKVHDYATNNAHMFYIVCNDLEERNALISFLDKKQTHAVFHYQSLHKSQFYKDKHDGRSLPNCDRYSNGLIRLPFFYEITEEGIDWVCNAIKEYYQ